MHRSAIGRLGLVLVMGLLGAVEPAFAQAAQEQAEQEQAAAYPAPFEASARYRALADAAGEAVREIAVLRRVDDLEVEFADARRQLDELRGLIVTVAEVEYMRPERMVRIRDRAIQLEQRLEAVRERAAVRIETLEEMRMEWGEHDRFWDEWRSSLAGDPRLPAVATWFERARERTQAVMERIDEALPDLVEVKDEATELRFEATDRAERVAAIRAGRREAMLERSEPVLFAPAYWEGLRAEALREWQPVAAVRAGAQVAFVRDNAGLLLLHIILIIGLIWLATHLSRLTIPEAAWSGLLLRPRALAVFATTAFLAPRYALAPALWDVVMWSLLAASGAVLATRLVRAVPLRRMVYFFAAAYPLILLAEALLVPAALFRPLLATLAAAGVVLVLALVRREVRGRASHPWGVRILGLGALIWAVVFVAEVLGFYLLARWIVHASVTSAYVVFVVVFVVVLARGAIGTLVRQEFGGRLRFLRTVGVPVIRQVLKVVQIVLVVVAFLYILDIWELAPSPSVTWRSIMGVGTTIAGVEVTVGRVLAAVILVYVAVASSWVLRTFAQSEVYPRWELERGVGDSINTLVHYFLITVGFFIGLGALGVELRNFAIVAGALGVGIGFGLQNIVNNFISGLILLFERPVRVGDTIVLGEELGIIEKIGLRSTTVLTLDRAEVIVPNGDLISEKVTNWTLTDPVARLIVPVGVAYGSNVARVLQILRETAARHPEVLPDPEPQTLFKEFGDSALEFELRVWVQELRFRLKVRSEILAEIDRRFREEGIEIPFPQRDLHVRSVDAGILGAIRPDDGPAGRESQDSPTG